MTIIRVPDWRFKTNTGFKRVGTVAVDDISPEVLPPGSGPFSATSPWRTQTPVDTLWFDAPTILTTLNSTEMSGGARSVGVGGPSRIWYAAESSVGIWHATNSDPLWTFEMPNYIFVPFNRNRSASTFTFHAPADMVENQDSDHILVVVNDDTGEYVEVWLAETPASPVPDPSDPTNASNWTKTTTGLTRVVRNRTQNGSVVPGWARGDAADGPGAGTTGGNNDGVRAANFSWLGGVITQDDIDAGEINHAIVIALNYFTLDGNGSNYNWLAPATAKDVGGAIGPIKMGTKIGIPRSSTPPGDLTPAGLVLWNCLQKYGAYVGDYAGGPWPIFYLDSKSITDTSYFHPWFAWWTQPGNVTDIDRINPYLKIANYDPTA